MNNIASRVAKKTGYPSLLDDLSEKLSASELNTLLLELFRLRAKKITPAELLRQFEKNRFAAASFKSPFGLNVWTAVKLADSLDPSLKRRRPTRLSGSASALSASLISQRGVRGE